MKIEGSCTVVIGGTGGVGTRLCRALVEAGGNVAIGYLRSQEKAESLASDLSALGPKVIAVQADIDTQAGIDKLLGQALDEFGRIDVLVHTAGINKLIPHGDLESLDEEIWNLIIHSNLTGPFLAMRSVVPIMKRQGQGRIVNVTSIAALAPLGSSIAYAVSKAGLTHLTRCFAKAFGPEVLVNSVAPGMMAGVGMVADFPASAAEGYSNSSALGRTTGVDDVVDAILTLIKTDSITGQALAVDAGMVYH